LGWSVGIQQLCHFLAAMMFLTSTSFAKTSTHGHRKLMTRRVSISKYHRNRKAIALVGMGTAFAGIVRAPMTSVVMIFEITRDYAVIVPLMISNLVSVFISSRLQRQPIYEVLARQDGIHLPSAETRQQQGQRQVIHAMRAAEGILLLR
jgi:H+/Cl- antiporter ClcA